MESAVEFLNDPSVANSSAASKIEFLKTKGLNDQEIDLALAKSLTNIPSDHLYYTNAMPPPLPPRSWKDYFIMATTSVGVSYAMYHVIVRYLLPAILPPLQSTIDAEKEAVSAHLQKIDTILEQMQLEQSEVTDATKLKLADVDAAVESVNSFLEEYAQDKTLTNDTLKLLKLEIDRVSKLIEKSLVSQLENMKTELCEIQNDLKSLRAILVARGQHGEPRKIVPASSLPYAADIIKRRAEAKNSVASTGEISAEPIEKSLLENSEASSTGVESPIVGDEATAVGIPAWQLAHKNAEEEEATEKADPSNVLPASQETKDGNTIDFVATERDPQVEENIRKVGIPSWQLHTNTDQGQIKSKE